MLHLFAENIYAQAVRQRCFRGQLVCATPLRSGLRVFFAGDLSSSTSGETSSCFHILLSIKKAAGFKSLHKTGIEKLEVSPVPFIAWSRFTKLECLSLAYVLRIVYRTAVNDLIVIAPHFHGWIFQPSRVICSRVYSILTSIEDETCLKDALTLSY